jgi:hypothetical protein
VSTLEDQVRAAFEELADEARPAPLLQRLEDRPLRRLGHRGLAVAAAAVVTLALVAASVWASRPDRPIVEPTVHPPKVVRLSDGESPAPGRSGLLLVLADPHAERFLHEKPAYLLPVGSEVATRLTESDVRPTWTEHLSLDGTRVVREVNREDVERSADQKWMEIVDLRTGELTHVPRSDGYCPALSPDNRFVAVNVDRSVAIIDVASGARRLVTKVIDYCGSLAWTPDSTRLVVHLRFGSVIVDRQGRRLAKISGAYPVNGSMSWSPDGAQLLLYDPTAGRFFSRDDATGSMTRLHRPADALRPVGWAGSRIVWIAGPAGEQRLVTTDQGGHDRRLWTRLDTDGLPIEGISWSTALSGTGPSD